MKKLKYQIKIYLKAHDGVSLYVSVLILSGILAVALGISSLTLGELKISQEVEHFMPALYAADSGIDRALYKIRQGDAFGGGPCDTLTACVISGTTQNGASYNVVVLDGGVEWCAASMTTCVRSRGRFIDTNRVIEIFF